MKKTDISRRLRVGPTPEKSGFHHNLRPSKAFAGFQLL
jgi:hypothetical protein